jgi:hypothetical protein
VTRKQRKERDKKRNINKRKRQEKKKKKKRKRQAKKEKKDKNRGKTKREKDKRWFYALSANKVPKEENLIKHLGSLFSYQVNWPKLIGHNIKHFKWAFNKNKFKLK